MDIWRLWVQMDLDLMMIHHACHMIHMIDGYGLKGSEHRCYNLWWITMDMTKNPHRGTCVQLPVAPGLRSLGIHRSIGPHFDTYSRELKKLGQEPMKLMELGIEPAISPMILGVSWVWRPIFSPPIQLLFQGLGSACNLLWIWSVYVGKVQVLVDFFCHVEESQTHHP